MELYLKHKMFIRTTTTTSQRQNQVSLDQNLQDTFSSSGTLAPEFPTDTQVSVSLFITLHLASGYDPTVFRVHSMWPIRTQHCFAAGNHWAAPGVQLGVLYLAQRHFGRDNRGLWVEPAAFLLLDGHSNHRAMPPLIYFPYLYFLWLFWTKYFGSEVLYFMRFRCFHGQHKQL